MQVSPWVVLIPALAIMACNTPDPGAEDPFQQLAKGPSAAQGPAPSAQGPKNPPGTVSSPDEDKAMADAAGGEKVAGADDKAAVAEPATDNGVKTDKKANTPENTGDEAGQEAPKLGNSMQAGGGLPPDDGSVGAPSTPDPRVYVPIKGTLEVDGYDGTIQLDFIHIEKPKSKEGHPQLTLLRMPEPGDFEVQVPNDVGTVDVVIYLDKDDNGPSQKDTQIYWSENPLKVPESGVSSFNISVSDQANPPPKPEGAPEKSD